MCFALQFVVEWPGSSNLTEAFPLPPLAIEVPRLQPCLERLFAGGPFAVEDREPCRVAVAVLDHHVLAEDAFVSESEAQSGLAAGLVERVALPLVAAIAQVVKDVARHQVHGLGSRACALERGRKQDVAHLDNAVGSVNAHERRPTLCQPLLHVARRSWHSGS